MRDSLHGVTGSPPTAFLGHLLVAVDLTYHPGRPRNICHPKIAIGVILPMALPAWPAVRRNSERLYGAALLVGAGFVVNRLSVSITALPGSQGGRYVPSIAEGVVTIMLVGIEIAAFAIAVRSDLEREAEAAASPTLETATAGT